MEQINRAKKRLQFIYFLFDEQTTRYTRLELKEPPPKDQPREGAILITLENSNLVPYYNCYDFIEIYSDIDLDYDDEFDEFQIEVNKYSMENLSQIRLILNDIHAYAVRNVEIYKTLLVPLLDNKEIKKVTGKHAFRNGHFSTVIKFYDGEKTSIVRNYDLAFYSNQISNYLQRVIYPNETGSDTGIQPVKSFDPTLTKPQLQKLFDELIKGNYIHPETDFKQFSDIFNAEVIESNQRVKWILESNKRKPHKTALRELLTLILGKSPEQKIVDACFTDILGDPIKLAKPKKNEYSNYYANFEKMIK